MDRLLWLYEGVFWAMCIIGAALIGCLLFWLLASGLARADEPQDFLGWLSGWNAIYAAQPRDGALTELDFAARAVYWEARGEPVECQGLVAAVAFNLLDASGGDVAAVVKKFQGPRDHRYDRITDDAAWRRAQGVAVGVFAARSHLLLGEIMAFHDHSITPVWPELVPVLHCGVLQFYRKRDKP